MQSLAAIVEEHSISLIRSLHPSIPRSRHHYCHHKIATMKEKPQSGPHIPRSLPESAHGRETKTETGEREGRDGLLMLSAGSEGMVTEG